MHRVVMRPLAAPDEAFMFEGLDNLERHPVFVRERPVGTVLLIPIPIIRARKIEIDGDTAMVTSYLQILTPNPQAEPFELSGHGTSKGFRVHRLSANRWELVRMPEGWRIKRRTGRSMDTPAARQLLRETTKTRLAKQG